MLAATMAGQGVVTMSVATLRTPVVLLIFNRPDTTAVVFERIAEVRPRSFFVVADGPRAGQPGDAEACAAARAVTERVGWRCEVRRDYADANLGCARRVASGLDWAFGQVEEAIILEDDCVPDPTFFPFCQELLELYRNDERIMALSGDNFQGPERRTPYSYYFSAYPHCWGWATWRRAWRHFDREMRLWPEIRDGGWLAGWFGDPAAIRFWTDIFERTRAGEFDSWAFPWTLACWAQGALSILPNVNLVANIGFDNRATHTGPLALGADTPTGAMEFPLRHPPYVLRNLVADKHSLIAHFGVTPERPFHRRALSRARRLLSSPLAALRRRLGGHDSTPVSSPPAAPPPRDAVE
jgi:GT2 family glycosyltransferase